MKATKQVVQVPVQTYREEEVFKLELSRRELEILAVSLGKINRIDYEKAVAEYNGSSGSSIFKYYEGYNPKMEGESDMWRKLIELTGYTK